MAMKRGFNPFVLLSGETPGTTTVTGGGSGMGTTDPFTLSMEEWLNSFGYDANFDEVINGDDYVWWWYECGFTAEQYAAANGGAELPPDPRPQP